jgi:hypothetical protein
VKDLHLDWRWGARHFMRHLVDGDLASNQHGWQWAAGTGTDASRRISAFSTRSPSPSASTPRVTTSVAGSLNSAESPHRTYTNPGGHRTPTLRRPDHRSRRREEAQPRCLRGLPTQPRLHVRRFLERHPAVQRTAAGGHPEHHPSAALSCRQWSPTNTQGQVTSNFRPWSLERIAVRMSSAGTQNPISEMAHRKWQRRIHEPHITRSGLVAGIGGKLVGT